MSQAESNQLGQYIPLHYHYQMLTDVARVTAFRAAIEHIVKPQHRVVELGSGTGIMSFFAARQGARVWAAEANPAMASASRKFLNENGVSNQVDVFETDASKWLPPEPVDLVICEMLHSSLLREKQVQVIADFRDAHYARFGKTPRMLPEATLLGVQPVWQTYDFEGYLASVPLFQSPYTVNEDCKECGDPVLYKIVDYDTAQVEVIETEILCPIQHAANVNALRFITKNILALDNSTGQTIDWHSQHLVLPLPHVLQIDNGQTMRVRFSYRPGDPIETLANGIDVSIV